ncbi:MAG: hypothetical protein ACRC41_10915 [Sarcina sp.]
MKVKFSKVDKIFYNKFPECLSKKEMDSIKLLINKSETNGSSHHMIDRDAILDIKSALNKLCMNGYLSYDDNNNIEILHTYLKGRFFLSYDEYVKARELAIPIFKKFFIRSKAYI